jgi:microcystin degradation protein MlrC
MFTDPLPIRLCAVSGSGIRVGAKLGGKAGRSAKWQPDGVELEKLLLNQLVSVRSDLFVDGPHSGDTSEEQFYLWKTTKSDLF